MFFNIDDLEIKNEVIKYKRGEEDKFDLLVKIITPFIYNYPRVVFHVTEDICSDFYEYILLRLKSILKSYTVSEAKFTTWFTVVLRNRYFNFLKRNKTENDYSYNLSFDMIIKNIDGSNNDVHSIIADNKNYNIHSNEHVLSNVIDKIISLLNDKYRVLFHLYYIDFLRVEDIRFLAIFFNRKIADVFKGIDKIKGSIISKYEKKEAILDKLAKNYQSILDYQKLGDKESENNAKKYHKILLNEYRAVRCFPSYESIASFCGFPLGTVSTGIARIKLKIGTIESSLQRIVNEDVWYQV